MSVLTIYIYIQRERERCTHEAARVIHQQLEKVFK